MDSADSGVTGLQLEALLAEVVALRNEVQQLRSEHAAAVEIAVSGNDSNPTVATGSSRRNFMRTAATAAASAVGAAVVVSAQPAAATAGTMVFGNVNDAGGSATRLVATVPNTAAFNVSNAGATGVGISSSSAIAFSGEAADTGVVANAGNTGGVFRGANRGIDAASTGQPGSNGSGVVASGQAYGVDASGQRAAIHLAISGGDPTLRHDAHAAGELYHEDNDGDSGRLWVCVSAGNPGVWREFASVESSGSFHAVLPRRVYDSRLDVGPLVADDSRIVSVRDGRSLSGAVEVVDLVPPGSTAVAYNLTIIDTIRSGFLAITPDGAPAFSASAINWTSSGTAVANASIVTVDGARNVKVWAGGGGATQFVLDIVGYYR